MPSQLLNERVLPRLQKRFRRENLEHLTFEDASVDIHVTQDVVEHLFDPDAAFREIARTLKAGGKHVFTVPLVRGNLPTRRRAHLVNGSVVHELPPEYHGNPVDERGALVTFDWGDDILERVRQSSGMESKIVRRQDNTTGVVGPLTEVVVSTKIA